MAEIAAVQTSLVGDGADDRARADFVPFPDGDAVGGERLVALGLVERPFGPILTAALLPPLLRRRIGRQQECLTVARLQRQRRGNVSHRGVVLAFVVLDEPAEQLDTRAAERVGDRIGELSHPLRVDVLDGGQLGLR